MRVTMLVQNDLAHDTRVIREARALAAQGHDVDVISRTDRRERATAERDGVTYHAIPHGTLPPWRHTARLLAAHARVLFVDARRIWTGPNRRRAVSSGIELLAVPLLGAGLLVSTVVHSQTRSLFSERSRLSRMERAVQPLRGRVHRLSRWLVQPFLYLNDHAANCLSDVSSLKPDAIHAHDLVTLSTAVLAARRTGAAVIYDSHEIETETNNWSLNRLTDHYVARYEATLVQEADAVVTVTEGIADWLADQYEIARPVVVMNAPLTGIDSRDGGLRTRLALPSDVPIVVYVGGVMADRGLEQCVRALPMLPSVHLALVGPRFPYAEAEVLDEARQAGVEARVHLVDPVPPDEVVSFISDADCGVIPIQNVCLSYYYCFPNKLLETVVAGLPVAVADLMELRRFVEETGMGLVMDERDPSSIAAAISELLEHPDRYPVTVAKVTQVLERYGWQVQESRLLDLYNSLDPIAKPSALESLVEVGR